MTNPLTESDLIEIEARCEAATCGPWLLETECPRTIKAVQDGMIGGVLYNTNGGADAAFIAAAREDVPRLVAEVRRLRGLLGKRGDE